MPDTPEDVVKEARELLAKATPWPWEKFSHMVPEFIIKSANGVMVASVAYVHNGSEHNAKLIARAPELLASMADELERLRDELEKIKGAGVP